MQYKIPVQIENEDPIVLWLSLRQLLILFWWWAIAYSLFDSIAPSVWNEVAAIPSIFIFLITLMIALFKNHEMTFIPFVLSILRLNLNEKTRVWSKWIDSFSKIDIWYISWYSEKKNEKIDFKSKIDKINELNEKINKI